MSSFSFSKTQEILDDQSVSTNDSENELSENNKLQSIKSIDYSDSFWDKTSTLKILIGISTYFLGINNKFLQSNSFYAYSRLYFDGEKQIWRGESLAWKNFLTEHDGQEIMINFIIHMVRRLNEIGSLFHIRNKQNLKFKIFKFGTDKPKLENIIVISYIGNYKPEKFRSLDFKDIKPSIIEINEYIYNKYPYIDLDDMKFKFKKTLIDDTSIESDNSTSNKKIYTQSYDDLDFDLFFNRLEKMNISELNALRLCIDKKPDLTYVLKFLISTDK